MGRRDSTVAANAEPGFRHTVAIVSNGKQFIPAIRSENSASVGAAVSTEEPSIPFEPWLRGKAFFPTGNQKGVGLTAGSMSSYDGLHLMTEVCKAMAVEGGAEAQPRQLA